jgi:hypothetical protein
MTLVPKVRGMSYREAELHALNKLKELYPQRLYVPGAVDVVETFELLQDKYEFSVSVAQLPPGIEGRTWPDGRVEISEPTYCGALNGNARARFTVAHECMHAWFHAFQIQQVLESGQTLVLNRRSNIPTYCDPEWQANALAAAFLMPLTAIKVLHNSYGPPTVATIMETFEVSRPAAQTRLEIIAKKGFMERL